MSAVFLPLPMLINILKSVNCDDLQSIGSICLYFDFKLSVAEYRNFFVVAVAHTTIL